MVGGWGLADELHTARKSVNKRRSQEMKILGTLKGRTAALAAAVVCFTYSPAPAQDEDTPEPEEVEIEIPKDGKIEIDGGKLKIEIKTEVKIGDKPAKAAVKVVEKKARVIRVDAAGGALVVADDDPFGATMSKANLLEPAEMKTDSGSQDVLRQADDFAKNGRYDLASILWQRVIDESGDQVFTKEEWNSKSNLHVYQKYRSVSGDIEGTIAGLPAEGLAAYRLKADGEARALMNTLGSRDRESALAEVVRRFFLSKLGDEAAFELACLKLDRGEFLPAARLLSKVANEYPDPTVPLGEVQLRLSAVNARVGDLKVAREMLAKIKAKPIPAVPIAVINLVEKDFDQVATKRVAASDRVGDWMMPQGSPERSGLMVGIKKDISPGLISGWKQGYKLTLPSGPEWDAIREAQDNAETEIGAKAAPAIPDPFLSSRVAAAPKQATDEQIMGKWRQHSWMPVGQVLMHGGKIYFKTHDRVVCCDAKTGELSWFGYRSEYPADSTVKVDPRRRMYGAPPVDPKKPNGEREVMAFSDMLNQSMTIVGDKLLVVQGKALDFYEDGDLDDPDGEEAAVPFRGFMGGAEQTHGRTRENRLFAYHSTNGKLLWMLKPTDLLPESKRPAAIAGSPVPYGSLVVVPVYEATSLWLFGLDPQQGKVMWKSFIADEPPGQTAQTSPVRIAIDGGEAYVATGAGIVASVDAISGTLNWAMAYPRTASAPMAPTRRGWPQQTAKLDGWKDDTIIPSGNTIIVAPSDFNHIVAFDRRTGNLAWESSKSPVEGEAESQYVLGVAEGRVYVAGPKIVRAYRVAGGRLLWEAKLNEDTSHGRGMLTKNGIYIPLVTSILHIDLENGKEIAKIEIDSATEEQPVGNLFTDGERIFAAGFRQIESYRLPIEGEVRPEEVKAPEGEEIKLDSKQALAKEGRRIFAVAYTKLAAAKTAEDVVEAGVVLDDAKTKLEELAQLMGEFGAPSPEEQAEFAKKFAAVHEKNAAKLHESLARIITVEESDPSVLEKLMTLHGMVEENPIFRNYGVSVDEKTGGSDAVDEKTAIKPGDGRPPFASAVPGKVGLVYSPFISDKSKALVSISDDEGVPYPPGTEMMCPITRKLFRVT